MRSTGSASDFMCNAVTFATMPEISGKPVRMQLDTGASCSVLPEKFVVPLTCISQTGRTLKMYSQSTMAVLGTCRVSMRNSKINKRYNVEFVVIKGDYTPLIGSCASQQINLVTVQQENILQVTPDSPADFTPAQSKEEFRDVFKDQG